jgi:5-formyltetrahydrofolate cyclo-ligase
MTKKEIRNRYREKRNALSPAEQSKLDDLLLVQFQTVELPFLHTLLSFWPIEENREPNTHLFTEFLRFRNPELQVAYPLADFTNLTMAAILTGIDTPFTKTELNIYEPTQGDIIHPGSWIWYSYPCWHSIAGVSGWDMVRGFMINTWRTAAWIASKWVSLISTPLKRR